MADSSPTMAPEALKACIRSLAMTPGATRWTNAMRKRKAAMPQTIHARRGSGARSEVAAAVTGSARPESRPPDMGLGSPRPAEFFRILPGAS
ncbi:MAG TPA: hypothetical protein DCQ64_30605 [Candidatus Rokubacteria bacterium]|nr:hypothetical protein [Candidatus Rokubacteria bacterium]